MTFGAADVVVGVGTPLDFRLGYGVFGGKEGATPASAGHIAVSPGQFGGHATPAVATEGDLQLLGASADRVHAARIYGELLPRPAEDAVMTGDGAAGFSLIDALTLVRHRLQVVMVMGNNGAWGLEKGPTQMLYGYDVIADLAPRTRYDRPGPGVRQRVAVPGERGDGRGRDVFPVDVGGVRTSGRHDGAAPGARSGLLASVTGTRTAVNTVGG